MEVLRSTEPMGQNTTVENISPGLKRKIPEDGELAASLQTRAAERNTDETTCFLI